MCDTKREEEKNYDFYLKYTNLKVQAKNEKEKKTYILLYNFKKTYYVIKYANKYIIRLMCQDVCVFKVFVCTTVF